MPLFSSLDHLRRRFRWWRNEHWHSPTPWRIRRCWAMVRLYWGGEDFDWVDIAELMRFQIRRTRQKIAHDNIVVDTDRIVRQMLIAEHLLTRMLDNQYFKIAAQRFPNYNSKEGKYWAQMITHLENQDDEMLATILRKHFRSWWD